MFPVRAIAVRRWMVSPPPRIHVLAARAMDERGSMNNRGITSAWITLLALVLSKQK